MKYTITLKNKYEASKIDWKKGGKRVYVGMATLVVNGVAISGIVVTRDVVNAKTKKLGDYHIAMPSRKGTDDNYYPICWVEAEKEEAVKIYERMTEVIEKEFEGESTED